MSIKKWFNDYADSVYSYIFLLVRDPHIAEDLTQDTFLKVVEKSQQFKGDSSVRTWIFRIAYTTTISYFRKKKPLVFYLDMKLHKSNSIHSSEETAILNEQQKQFYETLHRLKQNYKQVIILRHIQGLSTRETASILGCSEGKIKMDLSRALIIFKKELEKGGITDETLIRP